jgi:hypothetical protein
MIRYALRCAGGHGFEAWFRDSAAYDAQRAGGLVACSICGDAQVEKALMAPAVKAADRETGREAPQPVLSAPDDSAAAKALAALRKHVEENADYVGPRFAAEARRIHAEGGAERPIWGEATPSEAKALRDDGVPVAPLPPLPRRND